MNRRQLLGSVGSVALFPAGAGAGERIESPMSGRQAGFEAQLRLGSPQRLAGNHRWARISGGDVTGGLLRGSVQSGRMDWHVDPASGAVEVAVTCRILRSDGIMVELRDRSVGARAPKLAQESGLGTAPALFDAAGTKMKAPARLAGCLDADIGNGLARLRAFDLS